MPSNGWQTQGLICKVQQGRLIARSILSQFDAITAEMTTREIRRNSQSHARREFIHFAWLSQFRLNSLILTIFVDRIWLLLRCDVSSPNACNITSSDSNCNDFRTPRQEFNIFWLETSYCEIHRFVITWSKKKENKKATKTPDFLWIECDSKIKTYDSKNVASYDAISPQSFKTQSQISPT